MAITVPDFTVNAAAVPCLRHLQRILVRISVDVARRDKFTDAINAIKAISDQLILRQFAANALRHPALVAWVATQVQL